jgi:hypothetical protein
MDLASTVQIILQEAGYRTWLTTQDSVRAIGFEDSALMGFVVLFQKPHDLLENWSTTETKLLSRHAAALRKAEEKAWNVYSVLLCAAAATEEQTGQVRQIEENLERTRKIAACNLAGHDDVVTALLPILPIQYHPRLEGDDLTERLRNRIATFAPAAADAALDDSVAPAEVAELLRAPS